jgi:protein-S-isoprenylcysteine O-methyltransferase Ste14
MFAQRRIIKRIPEAVMVARLVFQVAVLFVVTSAILFGAAGTIRWAAGWLFLGELHGGALAVGLWMAKHSPELLEKRLDGAFQRSQPLWDKILLPIVFLVFLGWLASMGRWHGSVPPWVQGAGALLILACFLLTHNTFRENAFAAPVVAIQERHRVISTGPYRFVRHPMYAGALLFFIGAPLLMGSWIGLCFVPALAVVLAVRAVLEERTLAKGLPGYTEYAACVRFRLIPYVW